MTPTRTEGEKLFERYLRSQCLSFEFEKEYPGRSKRPDYTIDWKGRLCLFDVKDFEQSDFKYESAPIPDAYPLIREKIEKAREKFREYKDKDFCCSLVLYNRGNPLVRLRDSGFVLGAMYGDDSWDFRNPLTGERDFNTIQHKFLDRGKMIRPYWARPQNTTVSSIITPTTVRPSYHPKVITFDRSDWITVRPGNTGDKQRQQVIGNPSSSKRQGKATSSRYDNPREIDLLLDEPDYDDPEATIPRVIVWHNVVARTHFPTDLFWAPLPKV